MPYTCQNIEIRINKAIIVRNKVLSLPTHQPKKNTWPLGGPTVKSNNNYLLPM